MQIKPFLASRLLHDLILQGSRRSSACHSAAYPAYYFDCNCGSAWFHYNQSIELRFGFCEMLWEAVELCWIYRSCSVGLMGGFLAIESVFCSRDLVEQFKMTL